MTLQTSPDPIDRADSRDRATLTSAAALAQAGLVPPARLADAQAVAARYAVAVTPTMAALIDRDDPSDPIARQFLPDPAELIHSSMELRDPIGDDAHAPLEGLVHRYPDRVLIKLVSICPVYCRFCFRRETVGQKGSGLLPEKALATALDYVAAQPAIWEIIFSGGDPLILSPRRIRSIVARVAAIPHVKVVRWHSRVPVVSPERVTPALARALRTSRLATYVALHANHPRELTPQARAACARLIDAGIPMLSQTVLLKGVNDDEATLGALMRAFVETRVKPYYLHHLDRAPGTSHLSVEVERGRQLMRALRGRLSGLCQPAYVLDIPGGHGKSPIGPSYATARGDAPDWNVEDFQGVQHPYAG
jgi:lysine 2,3-aminomutase